MAARTRADDRDESTDVDFYLPAGLTRPAETSRLERLWGRLFDNGVQPPE